MSKENAKKLIDELQTNEELKAKIQGITDPAELVKKAMESGYDVTADELFEADKEYRKAHPKTEKSGGALTDDEVEAVAGGYFYTGEDASDGHEMGCDISYHLRGYSEEHDEWCRSMYYHKSCTSIP